MCMINFIPIHNLVCSTSWFVVSFVFSFHCFPFYVSGTKSLLRRNRHDLSKSTHRQLGREDDSTGTPDRTRAKPTLPSDIARNYGGPQVVRASERRGARVQLCISVSKH